MAEDEGGFTTWLTINTAAADTGLSVQQVRTLIKQFIELGIIRKVKEFPRHMKMATVWEYVSSSQVNTQHNMEDNILLNTRDVNHSNDLEVLDNNQVNSQINNQISIQSNKSKKELSKEKILNTNNCGDILVLFNLYPNQLGKKEALELLPQLIEKYGVEQMKRCIGRYANYVQGKDRRYIKKASNFFKEAYMDYLDENYLEEQSTAINTIMYDEETGEVIRI